MVFLDWLPSRGFLCPQFLVAFLAGFSWFPCSSQARALSAWRWRTAYCEAVMDRTQKSYTVGHVYWLVVWNIFIFPFSWEFHHPNWLICFKMVKTTNQYIYIYIVIGTRSKVMEKCPKFIGYGVANPPDISRRGLPKGSAVKPLTWMVIPWLLTKSMVCHL